MRNLFISIPVVVVLLAGRFSCIAQDNIAHYETKYLQANKQYSNGAYDSAVMVYEEIISAGYESSVLYFNLGNSYYKLKQVPMAILYYEKAKKLAPDDSDILFNLQLANQHIVDKFEPLPELFYSVWWNKLINAASVDKWGMWVFFSLLYAATVMILFAFSSSVFIRKFLFASGIIAIVISCFSFVFAWQQEAMVTSNSEAIVFTPTVTVKSSPDDNSTSLFVIHEGNRVKLMETVNDWYKIALLDGNVGWLRKDDVKEI